MNLIKILLFLSGFSLWGQTRNLQFIQLPVNAYQAAEGGVNAAPSIRQWYFFDQNPAVLGFPDLDDHLQLSVNPFFAGLYHYQAGFNSSYQQHGFGISFQGFNGGDFSRYNSVGQQQGSFSVGQHQVLVAYGTSIKPFSIGVSARLARLAVDRYQQAAVSVNAGIIYTGKSNDFHAGFLISNLGTSWANYPTQSDLMLPFNITFSTSFKPEYMPFRFHLSFTDLYQWDIRPVAERNSPSDFAGVILDNLEVGFYHLRIGTELSLGERIALKAAYNHRIRASNRVGDIAGASGLTIGGVLSLKRFQFAYSWMSYHLSGAASFITLGYAIGPLLNKEKPELRP